jgi:deoxyribose-phosphate aldolase
MLELGYLDSESEVRRAAQFLEDAGVPWVKNSSGVGPGSVPATPENIALLRSSVSSRVKVKGSGKIDSYEKAVALIDAGAELLGTSAAPRIIDELTNGRETALGAYSAGYRHTDDY